jgi:arabinofuranan 3-O-arabinosyltransferase
LTLTEVSGPGQVRISEIGAGVRVPSPAGSSRLPGCVPIAAVDGVPLRVALGGTLDQLTRGQTLPLRPCGPELTLAAGDHQLDSATGWLVDLLALRSDPAGAAGAAPSAPPEAPRLTVDSSSLSGASITTEPAREPFYLVLGQGYDPRWVASIDGQPLGPPRVLDGYSVGWRISDPRGHRITVSFGPQRWATLSLLASLAGLALVLALLLTPLWLRRRRPEGGGP